MIDRNDIELLFKANYAHMHRMAKALLHDDDIARDIVHDVFASLLDNPDQAPVSKPYLLKAVRNRCLNHIRNLETRQRIKNLYFLQIEEYDSEDWPDEETIAHIQTLIRAGVSPQARKAIQLRYMEGRPFAEISTIMGISETAIFRHIKTALTLIRKKLNNNG